MVDTEWQAERHLLDSHTASPIGVCTVHCIALITDYSLLCYRCMKHSATYIRSVSEYALQINGEDFYCGNVCKKNISSVVGNLKCGFLTFHFAGNKASWVTSPRCVFINKVLIIRQKTLHTDLVELSSIVHSPFMFVFV